ncbi:MAG: hypothetical protein HEQ35_14260 [Gloeotrichia echinulata IR180]
MVSQQEKELESKKSRFHFSVLCLGASFFAISTMGFLSSPAPVQAAAQRPSIATVKSMTNGDISCYVDLVDQKGKKYEQVPATFEICAEEKTYLNKKVKLTYSKQKVSDCQSAEPCGKTKIVILISKMKIVR